MSIRSALFLSCVIFACAARADSWDDLRGLERGANIKVRDNAGTDYHGGFIAITPESLSMETGKGQVSVDRPRVQRVQVRSGSRRVRNAVIGAAIGIAVGVTIDQTLGVRLRNEGNETGRALMYAGPIALFGGLGGAFPSYRTIYRIR